MDPTGSLSEGLADLSVSDQSRSLTRVSPERDHFDDDDHKRLDAQIALHFHLYLTLDKLPRWPALLWVIISKDTRLVNRTEEEAEELLKSHPSINTILQTAWKEASFKEVRRLSILWPVVQEAPRPYASSNQNMAATIKAVESAWLDNYSGDNHRLLFANLNAIPSTKQVYSNQIAIVQSSGTGKSRMVHEQANLVFTIPFNLREKLDNQGLAFPRPDDAVRDYLLDPSLLVDQHVLNTAYLNFLGSLFKQLNVELRTCQADLNKTKTAEDLAKWWSSHLEGRRTELYIAAIKDAGTPNTILPKLKENHRQLLAQRRSNPQDLNDVRSDNLAEFAAAEAARTALDELIKKLGRSGAPEIKLIIYFDEAHPLTKVGPENDDGKTNYDFLCSCLNQFLDFPVFFIFLSTNSSLAHFAAPRALAKSARIRGGEATLHAPITETPFDCCDSLTIGPGDLSMDDISTIPFMAKFGRPLFWTMLRGAGVWEPHLHTPLLDLARAKLIASSNINSDYISSDRNNVAAALAVLDVQLSMDFEPRREKVQIEEARLVESHMRIAFSIPDHREYLRSGYPSEPLLAEAAAQQLWRWRSKNRFMVVQTLTDILESGLLNRGELGELTGRQLLLDAYHRAVELEHSKFSPPSHPNFSAGCRLITFIEMLFTDECAAKVLDSEPDNMKGKPFKETFKDAHICFTHFGKMADDTGVTSTAAWAAFIRHMAIMCRNNQEVVDCIIPVALCSRDVKLCEHVMTGVLVQFKRRIQAGTIAATSIDEVKLNFFPRPSEKCAHGSGRQKSYRPYVCLVMELGVQAKAADETKTLTKFGSDRRRGTPAASAPVPPAPGPIEGGPDKGTPSKLVIPHYGERHHEVEGHGRYSVFAYGASPTIYRGIDAAHKDSYALLLQTRDFLGEHPRKDVRTLKAVRRMKPFWNGGDDCYHWIKHNDILHNPAPPPEVEFAVGMMY